MTYWISCTALGGVLDEPLRSRILGEIIDLCLQRDWLLSAAHVQTGRVRVIVATSESSASVNRTLLQALRRHWRNWSADPTRSLQPSQTEPAIQATLDRDFMAVFVAAA